jgi:transcriptional regulator with XRE-family HTH domain
MSIGGTIQAWRISRKLSIDALTQRAGLGIPQLEAIEDGQEDPSVTTVSKLANALGVPPSWLYDHPQHFTLLFETDEMPDTEEASVSSVDPVIERILIGTQADRTLFVLLTSLLQHGDPRLIRAAEINLRSLVKQCRQTTVPWESRPPGHFEPPSD